MCICVSICCAVSHFSRVDVCLCVSICVYIYTHIKFHFFLQVSFQVGILISLLDGYYWNRLREKGFPGGASGKEPTCQFRRYKI